MKIQQATNGNILLLDNENDILHILSSVYIQKHPRKENAILISDGITAANGTQGISLLASTIESINEESFNGDVYDLLGKLSTAISLNGTIATKNEASLTKENDPNYVAYLQANTFEKLLAFIKLHKSNIGGIKEENGKVLEEEYLCQFETFIIRVTLRYTYRTDKPNLVDEILMYGSTEYVLKPTKVYQYDVNDTIIGYQYREI
ncbi:hypothetical protein [uncultured Tenacibaculum sp.]|uniref:hypothetical protein n=1 Tax=uncultured Tenacibaculum sp. TaxID=174713 RepID=UPI0026043765|nr:hypothetical protein [uncultured Tenacibaculum sp.]